MGKGLVKSMDGKTSKSENSVYVNVSVLPAGHLTLPEHVFCADQHDRTVRNTVPSLSFLVQHPSGCRLIFDLGIRRDLNKYPAALRSRLESRQPITGVPDVSASLREGGLASSDIDVVVLSHVHYDHIGTPSDFPGACFVIGPGTSSLLQSEGSPRSPGHFEKHLLPHDRTIELPAAGHPVTHGGQPEKRKISLLLEKLRRQNTMAEVSSLAWRSLGPFDAAIDLFDDGSVYIVNSPGHLDGHINMLCRTPLPGSMVYLAGDACHHERILTGEAEIATWEEHGVRHCIHQNKTEAEDTLKRIRRLKENGLPHENHSKVQVVLAHDSVWADKNREAVFPGCIM